MEEVEVGATTTGVADDNTGRLDVEDGEAEAKTTTVEWLAEAVSDTDEGGGGVDEASGAVEKEGGAVPDITTVAAWKTVLVMYVVDVKNVVRAPASEDSAKVSDEEKRTTKAPRRGFERRIASASVVLRERRWRLWGVVCLCDSPT